jgi:hypothetical protein
MYKVLSALSINPSLTILLQQYFSLQKFFSLPKPPTLRSLLSSKSQKPKDFPVKKTKSTKAKGLTSSFSESFIASGKQGGAVVWEGMIL